MSKPVDLGVEQLESRDTPSGTPFAESGFLPPGGHLPFLPTFPFRTPFAESGFLPPGLARGQDAPDTLPPPVQVGGDGSLIFLPPGGNRGNNPPETLPPPV